jgi:Tfp pilus assembly protein PilF
MMKAGLDALYARNDTTKAATEFRDVLKRNPNHYGATFQLAMALDRAGKMGEARPLWEKVLSMAEAARDEGTATTARGRLAKPAVTSEEAIQAAMMQSGLDLLYSKGDPSAAAAQFSKVLEHNPNHYGATFQRAIALDHAGRPGEARPLWERMLKLAEAANDKATMKTASERLARRDQ